MVLYEQCKGNLGLAAKIKQLMEAVLRHMPVYVWPTIKKQNTLLNVLRCIQYV